MGIGTGMVTVTPSHQTHWYVILQPYCYMRLCICVHVCVHVSMSVSVFDIQLYCTLTTTYSIICNCHKYINHNVSTLYMMWQDLGSPFLTLVMASPDFPLEGDETDDMEGEEFIHWVRIHTTLLCFYCTVHTAFIVLHSTLLHVTPLQEILLPISDCLFVHSRLWWTYREGTYVRAQLLHRTLRPAPRTTPGKCAYLSDCFDSHTVLIHSAVTLFLSSLLQSAPPLLPTVRTREEVLQRKHTGLPRLLLKARWDQYW